MSGPDVERRLAEEAVRVYRRYAIEAVEGLGFCPYAERARLDGLTRVVPMAGADPTDEELLQEIERIADQPEIELALLLLPRRVQARPAFGVWVERMRKLHNRERGGTSVLAIEGFHPDAAANLETAARLTPFVRRTPDLTLQLTRLDSLEKVRRAAPGGTAFMDLREIDMANLAELLSTRKTPIHKRIADANLATVEAMGVAAIEAIFEDIVADRDRSYRAIDPTVPMRRPDVASDGE